MDWVDLYKKQLKLMCSAIKDLLPKDFPESRISDLVRHVNFADKNDLRDILLFDLPDIEEKLTLYSKSKGIFPAELSFEDMLHPLIKDASLHHLNQEHFRIAVIEGVSPLFRVLQSLSGVADDGDSLAAKALKPGNPKIVIVDNITSETGRSIQRGMQLLCQGVHSRFRNPRAHTGAQEIDRKVAAQELVTISRLIHEIQAKGRRLS